MKICAVVPAYMKPAFHDTRGHIEQIRSHGSRTAQGAAGFLCKLEQRRLAQNLIELAEVIEPDLCLRAQPCCRFVAAAQVTQEAVTYSAVRHGLQLLFDEP